MYAEERQIFSGSGGRVPEISPPARFVITELATVNVAPFSSKRCISTKTPTDLLSIGEASP